MSNCMNVIVVGTSHKLQIADMKLKQFLIDICFEFDIRGVAEEMSLEVLTQRECATDIPMQVATECKVPHLFCDPNNREREQLGIRQESDIRVSGFLSNLTLSEADVAALVLDSNAKREQCWLERLYDFNVWPLLFVCGADHVASFCEILNDRDISTYVAVEDWPLTKEI